ncbi:DUF4926 domain-containing protein [candidate division KSB1 bacterium]|nr:DUF4926 domain-containing protein [candidate division KSB1 bacterium]
MISELDLVVLNHEISKHGLKAGDVGTVVHCYEDGVGYEVEFVTAEGKTLAVLTLTETDIRPFQRAEILHAREVDAVLA